MRLFTINATVIAETGDLGALMAAGLPEHRYLWIACTRAELGQMQAQIQAALQALCGVQLVDLHISDLLNEQLPSRYDYTSQYDMLVFRRLAAGGAEGNAAQAEQAASRLPRRGGPPVLRRIDTSPVGFAVFDQ